MDVLLPVGHKTYLRGHGGINEVANKKKQNSAIQICVHCFGLYSMFCFLVKY